MSTRPDGPERPVLRIVRGDASAEEIAALVTVLRRRHAGTTAGAGHDRRVGGWADPASAIRPALRPGPGAWRASAWLR